MEENTKMEVPQSTAEMVRTRQVTRKDISNFWSVSSVVLVTVKRIMTAQCRRGQGLRKTVLSFLLPLVLLGNEAELNKQNDK